MSNASEQESARADAEAKLHVLFKIADSEYALPADQVLQMESFAGATPVPGAAPFVVGIVQIRGRVIPLVDLRVRFGAEAGDIPRDDSGPPSPHVH